jgi:hypothetical protein
MLHKEYQLAFIILEDNTRSNITIKDDIINLCGILKILGPTTLAHSKPHQATKRAAYADGTSTPSNLLERMESLQE